MMRQPSLISLVITFPPKGMTAVCLIIPSLKIAKSVVPPPISINATPASFSSSLKTASADASGSKVMLPNFKPALVMQLPIFRMLAPCPTTT